MGAGFKGDLLEVICILLMFCTAVCTNYVCVHVFICGSATRDSIFANRKDRVRKCSLLLNMLRSLRGALQSFMQKYTELRPLAKKN